MGAFERHQTGHRTGGHRPLRWGRRGRCPPGHAVRGDPEPGHQQCATRKRHVHRVTLAHARKAGMRHSGRMPWPILSILPAPARRPVKEAQSRAPSAGAGNGLYRRLRHRGPHRQPAAVHRSCPRVRFAVHRIRCDPHRRGLGRRRPGRQADRLQARGAGQRRRNRGVFLGRMARQGHPRCRDAEDDGRPAHGSGEEPDALRRRAHDLRRIRTGAPATRPAGTRARSPPASAPGIPRRRRPAARPSCRPRRC